MDDSIAILYQAQPVPPREGIVKPMKQGGYSDSGADIGAALHSRGYPLCTPTDYPSPKRDFDWVFPDTSEGIQQAILRGARRLWLNTVLYTGHAVESYAHESISCVGQIPSMADRFDNKLVANALARQHGFPVADSVAFDAAQLPQKITFPVMLKPVRGRGSQGVYFIRTVAQLRAAVDNLVREKRFGTRFYLEPYLPGQEITISVLPPGTYRIAETRVTKSRHWCLPAVERTNHRDGIMPYSGEEPVSANSKILSGSGIELHRIMEACMQTAELLKARGLLRIDCRADESGKFFIFDINMKPNLTGTSREHRTDQQSLTMIAAKGMGWEYPDLIENLANQHWPINELLKQ